MSRLPDPPRGFGAAACGGEVLLARIGLEEPLERSGLHRAGGWQQRLGASHTRTGRGATAVVDLGRQPRMRIKQLRRGGATAGLWRDRFPGRRRLLDNLRVPIEAAARGVPTPLPIALMLLEGPPGLYRGWLGLEEIEDARDLATRFASDRPPKSAELASAMRAVRRMHDAGVEHRDLNLGNLLLEEVGSAAPRAWVIDLDRARLHAGPLGFDDRQAALRRLERSYVKSSKQGRASDGVRDSLYALYADEDSTLSQRLERGRGVGRGWIRVHRMGWRR